MSNSGALPGGLEEIGIPIPSALTATHGNSDAMTIAAAPPHKIQPLADIRASMSGFSSGRGATFPGRGSAARDCVDEAGSGSSGEPPGGGGADGACSILAPQEPQNVSPCSIELPHCEQVGTPDTASCPCMTVMTTTLLTAPGA